MKHPMTLTSTPSTNQNPPSFSLSTLTQHTLACGHRMIVPTSPFGDYVVGTLPVGTLTEAHKFMNMNKKEMWLVLMDNNCFAKIVKKRQETKHLFHHHITTMKEENYWNQG
jgi:hypothetical protein